MTEQAQQKASEESLQQSAEVAAVLAVLMAGPPLLAAVQAISAALKMPPKLALAAFSLLKYKPGKKASPLKNPEGPGAAGKTVDPLALARRKNLWYRAAYVVNAVKRLSEAPDLQAGLVREQTLFAAHQEACKRRLEAAQKTGTVVASTGSTVIGWGGILDDRTTPDCRWLIGKNFAAGSPPDGLYPGARHPRCRCFSVPAHPGKPVVTKLPENL